MTAGQVMAIGAVLLAVAGAVVVAMRVLLHRANGAAEAMQARQQIVRQAAQQVRRFNRIARRIEARLRRRTEQLRQLTDRAERLAGQLGSFVAQAAPQEGKQPISLLVEKQRDLIFRLSFQGLEPIDIARRLELPVGEVELTLNLRKSQQDAGQDQPQRRL